MNCDQLLYLVAAFGSEENYKTFIEKSRLRETVNFPNCHRLAIYIALKYRNMNLITYFLKYMKTDRDCFEKPNQPHPSIMLECAT